MGPFENQIETNFIEAEEKRWVYGTQDEKWHLVGKKDRDFKTGITQDMFTRLGKEASKAVYLSR